MRTENITFERFKEFPEDNIKTVYYSRGELEITITGDKGAVVLRSPFARNAPTPSRIEELKHYTKNPDALERALVRVFESVVAGQTIGIRTTYGSGYGSGNVFATMTPVAD